MGNMTTLRKKKTTVVKEKINRKFKKVQMINILKCLILAINIHIKQDTVAFSIYISAKNCKIIISGAKQDQG